MREYETRKVERESKVLVLRICDWCGRILETEAKRSERALRRSMSNDQHFEFRFVTNTGTGIYLTGEGWEIEDLCIDCIDKLHDLFVREGIKITEVSY